METYATLTGDQLDLGRAWGDKRTLVAEIGMSKNGELLSIKLKPDGEYEITLRQGLLGGKDKPIATGKLKKGT